MLRNKYEELSEKAKMDYIERIDPYDFTDNLMEDLRNIGLQNLRPYYRLSYCHGDGLYLAGHINFDEISPELKKVFCKNFILSDYKIFKNLNEYSRIEFNHIGRYYHKYSVEIDVYIDGNLSTQKYQNHRKIADKLIKNIKEWYISLCDEYEKWGYEFFYGVEDEELQELCNAKGYRFLEDGTIFN